MKFLYTLSAFAFTLILALIAFTYTAINFSATMRDLLIGVQHVRDQVQQAYLSDNYMVWVNILLQPSLIVFVGFSIMMQLLAGIIASIFEFGADASLTGAAPPAASSSPFGRWG
jgi:hypothetical protein